MTPILTTAVWFALLCGIGAVLYGFYSSKWILGLDAGKEFENETPRPKLVAHQSRREGVLAVEGGRQVDAVVE